MNQRIFRKYNYTLNIMTFYSKWTKMKVTEAMKSILQQRYLLNNVHPNVIITIYINI